MRLDSVYVTYWSLRDPLCQSQSLPVVRGLAARGWRLGLITFEQDRWAGAGQDDEAWSATLRSQGIEWLPLRYHRRPRLLATAFDVLRGIGRCLRLRATSGVRLFHGRASVAAAVALFAARLSNARLFDDADGPLSTEYVDAGLWTTGSLSYRLTAWCERQALRHAHVVGVLTSHREAQVKAVTSAPVHVLPCGVDTEVFSPRPEDGLGQRDQLSLHGLVLVYSGKAGGWYLRDAMLDFASELGRMSGTVTLLVLTTQEPAVFEDAARDRRVRCVVRGARPEEMPVYLSAARAGLSFRQSTASQLAASPIKNAEYLACGLPVVSTAGAGDYGELLRRERVGVVVESLDPAGLRAGAEELTRLLEDADLPARCRAVAVRDLGLREVVLPRYTRIYESLLGSATTPPGSA